MKRRALLPFLALLALLGAPGIARADADAETPVFAVQNRRFNLKHEFHLGIGTLPINAFTKGVTVGVGYTYHFNELWGWEIAGFTYSFGVDTALRQELLENFEAQPTRITWLNWFASTSVVFKPLYGKLALTNRWLVHMEVFFALGAAVGGFVDATGATNFTRPAAVRGGFDVGGGLRVHLTQHFSLRFDIRDYTFIKSGGTVDELFLGLSAAITFGGGKR